MLTSKWLLCHSHSSTVTEPKCYSHLSYKRCECMPETYMAFLCTNSLPFYWLNRKCEMYFVMHSLLKRLYRQPLYQADCHI